MRRPCSPPAFLPACSRPTSPIRAPIATARRSATNYERIGYQGAEKAGARKFSAMFELHIEQGPILEDEGRMIGIVQGVQGMRWYEVTVTGQEAHTGATPMRLRKNALLGAARMIDRINAIALEHAPERGRLRRPDRKQAEQPQRHSRRSVFHHRFPPPGRQGARRYGSETAGRARRDSRAAEAHLQGSAHLGLAGGQIRAGADRMRAPRRGKGRLHLARHDFRRRPRRRLRRPASRRPP